MSAQIKAIKIEIEFMGIKRDQKILTESLTQEDQIGGIVEEMISSIVTELKLKGVILSPQTVAFLMTSKVKETLI